MCHSSDLNGYRDISTAYKIALKSLARRYLELHDEIADLDVMISVIVDELAPELITGKAIGKTSIQPQEFCCSDRENFPSDTCCTSL
ncbi:hypothetical protein SAMN06297164_0074 [Nitrosomonas ureae]|uniref:Uncharacterized protein n=1 Tax=Nitrosomonas ureae TaxID=44577 RepID=A0A286A1N5_9PROT|nr:hypothetical protein SAMN06297164_0074 [Nitrosomonas ureae]